MQSATFTSSLVAPKQGAGEGPAPAENGTLAPNVPNTYPSHSASLGNHVNAPTDPRLATTNAPAVLPPQTLQNGYPSDNNLTHRESDASFNSDSVKRTTSTHLPVYTPGAVSLPPTSFGLPPPPPKSGLTIGGPPIGGGQHTSTRVGTSSPKSGGGNTPRTGGNTPNSPASPGRRRSSLNNLSRTQPTSRIDPEQVPRPVGQCEPVKEEGGKVFETTKYHVPPTATQVCTIVDKGSASCEFMRSTVNQVPAFPSAANTTHVPLAMICQPFAELAPQETPIPLIDYGETGPLRCTRCRAYVNPHFTWASNGREAICNFCGQRREVPADYQCALDEKYQRRDYETRPELQLGTVDFVAPTDYSDVLPGVPGILIVIEASLHSLQSGFFHQVLWTLRSCLGHLPPNGRLGIMIFDHVLHYFAFHPNLEEPRHIIVSDIEDPFVPCGGDCLCVDLQDEAYFGQAEVLLERLPDMFAEGSSDQVVGNAALKAGVELMASRGGGHVLMFHSNLPNSGVGALRNRDDIRLYGTSEGSQLYLPQQQALFDTISADCLAKGVAVSAFLAPATGTYIDAASLSLVPRRTGGELFLLPGFIASQHGEKLHYQMSRTVLQESAYSCIFKLRCSKGLAVDTMYATWDPEVIDQSTFQVSRLASDSTAVFVLNHTERMEGAKHAYFQAACLYTNRSGKRLIRVQTLQLPISTSLSNIFRYTEVDAVTNMLLKSAAACAMKGDMSFKDRLTKSCVDMLHGYRINCAATSAAGQLILPESLKLLPLYMSSLRKMPAFRSGSDVRMDERLAGLTQVLGLSVARSLLLIYPRVHPMCPLGEKYGRSTGCGDNVYVPHTVAASYDRLDKTAIHLIDNGVALHLFIGNEVGRDMLERVFGVLTFQDVPAAYTEGVMAEVSVSEDFDRIMAIVRQIRKDRSRLPYLPLNVVIPGSPEEGKLHALFAEDRIAGELPYVDYLCHVHKMVQNKTTY